MDLDLHIGSSLHLELPPNAERAVVRLIGLVPGATLIVTAPERHGQLLPVADGDQLLARVHEDAGVVAFSCRVQRYCTAPFPYLHLSYPSEAEATPMRHARRARVHLLGTAETDAAPGREVQVTLHDLSTLGAQVWADVPLGEVGQAMILRVPLEHEPLGAQIAEVVSEIRNTHEDPGPPKRRWGYGVEFSAMSSGTALALRTLLLHELRRAS